MIDINKEQQVYSSLGKINAVPTARVAKNEVIWTPPKRYIDLGLVHGNYSDGKDTDMSDTGLNGGAATKVHTGKIGKDTELANVGNDDVIFGSLVNPNNGLKFQDDPVMNRLVLPMMNRINNDTEKMKKAHLKHGMDLFAINSETLRDKLTLPMLNESNKYLAGLENDLRSERNRQDIMKLYNLHGLLTARNGKDCMILPGFDDGLEPMHHEEWIPGYGMVSMPGDTAGNNFDPIVLRDAWSRNNAAWPSIIANSSKKDKKSAFDYAFPEGSDARIYPNSPSYYLMSPSIPKLNIKIADDLKNNTAQPVVPTINSNSNDEYGPYKLNPYDSLYVNGVGALGAIGQAIEASGQRLSSPNLYAANPYSREALAGMAGIKYDPYWIKQYMQQNNRNIAYKLNSQGGLTAGLRYLGRIGAQLGTNEQFAKLDLNVQDINNKYKLSYYDALNKLGQAELNARMTANQANYNAWAASHNAREQYKQMAYKNLMSYLTQAYKDYSDAKMYNGMRSLYWQDLDNRKKDSLAKLRNK